jgi:dienelactone hydrolase
MSFIEFRLSRAAAITVVVLLMGGSVVRADEPNVKIPFEEFPVEFQNQDVKLVGSLLLPRIDGLVPAVVFVHGAGRQTREDYREVGEHFAGQGIAALIYDKRGVGGSGGEYESREPYENLVNDALAAVAHLKQRPGIDSSRIGMWGLSQGAYIAAAAASRTQDIRFVVAAGASVADGTLAYYRDNLFRKYGLSETLRDVAEKAQLILDTLPHNLRDESLLATFSPKTYPPPDQYVHPAWSRVRQPVLAIWGQLDQHTPVAEGMAGLKNSLAVAGNRNWTMIVLPKAKHSLGISDTGAIQEPWRGYAPDTLKTMTDWVRTVSEDPSRIDGMKQIGTAEPSGVLSSLMRYDRLRWCGNGTVQSVLWLVFFAVFLTNTIAGIRNGFYQLFRRRSSDGRPEIERLLNLKRAIGAFNLLILTALGIVTLLVLDQMRPSCPAVLLYLPLLGSVSAAATVGLMIVMARTPLDPGGTMGWRVRRTLEALCFVLFVPYLWYWNAIGLRF